MMRPAWKEQRAGLVLTATVVAEWWCFRPAGSLAFASALWRSARCLPGRDCGRAGDSD